MKSAIAILISVLSSSMAFAGPCGFPDNQVQVWQQQIDRDVAKTVVAAQDLEKLGARPAVHCDASDRSAEWDQTSRTIIKNLGLAAEANNMELAHSYLLNQKALGLRPTSKCDTSDAVNRWDVQANPLNQQILALSTDDTALNSKVLMMTMGYCPLDSN